MGFNIFSKRCRIVKDTLEGYEVQGKTWYCPFWRQLHDDRGRPYNSFSTVQEALEFALSRLEAGRVVVRDIKWKANV